MSIGYEPHSRDRGVLQGIEAATRTPRGLGDRMRARPNAGASWSRARALRWQKCTTGFAKPGRFQP